MKTYTWLQDYKKRTECVDGEFGHNCEFNFLPHFNNMGGKIRIEDYYSIYVGFPDDARSGGDNLAVVEQSLATIKLFKYILTKLPGCSICRFNEKKNELYLEWHY